MWKVSIWLTFLCALPYFIFFGTRGYVSTILVLVLATGLAFVLMYYVLFRATELPKK